MTGVSEGQKSESVEPVLEVAQLAKSFAGVQALEDVSLRLDEGRVLGIIGPNGAGKSTLINVVTGMYAATGGRVTFEGKDLTRASLAERARRGLVRSFQTTRTFGSLSVREALNLAADAPRARSFGVGGDDVARALVDFGLESYASRAAAKLPYGAQKVLNLALVALSRPRALLLDEPFAGVDASDVARLAAVIGQLARRRVAIGVVEHNIEALLRLADSVTVIDSGRTIFDGSPSEARTSEVVQVAYLGHGAAGRRTRR